MRRGNMLKVLIADDEEKICQLIIKLINWEEMGLKIAATDSNGIEALEQDGTDPESKRKTAGYRDHHNQWIQTF